MTGLFFVVVQAVLLADILQTSSEVCRRSFNVDASSMTVERGTVGRGSGGSRVWVLLFACLNFGGKYASLVVRAILRSTRGRRDMHSTAIFGRKVWQDCGGISL